MNEPFVNPPGVHPDDPVLVTVRTASATLRPCEMYVDHGSSVPVITQGHHVYPVFLQNRKYGQIQDGTLQFLCGTCHDSVHAWLYWLLGERAQPAPTPPRARLLAQRAYDWYVSVEPVSPTP